MSGENPASTTEYIQHHLQNLVYGKLPEGFERHSDVGGEVLSADTWTMAHGATEVAAMGFWAIHVDSMMWSIGLGIIFCWMFRAAAVRATTGVPSGFLNFVERVGNKLPDPAIIFLFAMLLIWLLSWWFSGVTFDAIDPRTGEAIIINKFFITPPIFYK